VNREGFWAPLAYPDYARLWSGFLVSHVGDAIQMHAQAWLVTELTHSGLKLGGVVLAQAIPRLVFGVFAGVIVDRVDRRRLLIWTQTLAMVQSVLFFALVATHRITYPMIIVLAAALGTFDTLNLNARITLMPMLVPPALIPRSIAMTAVSVNVVQIAGPTLAAILIGSTGIPGCLAANALTFLVALVSLVRTPNAPGSSHQVGATFGDELREGFAFARARTIVWASIALCYAIGLFGMSVNRLIALYASVVLHTDGRGYAFLATAMGVGALGASLLVTARAKPSQLPRNIVLSAVAFSLSILVLARMRSYLPAFVALIAFGAGQMASRSAVTTTIQTVTPNRLRGRVTSLLTLDFSLWSVGAIALGWLADRVAGSRVGLAAPRAVHDAALAWSLHWIFVGAGLVCFVVSLALGAVILRARVEPHVAS